MQQSGHMRPLHPQKPLLNKLQQSPWLFNVYSAHPAQDTRRASVEGICRVPTGGWGSTLCTGIGSALLLEAVDFLLTLCSVVSSLKSPAARTCAPQALVQVTDNTSVLREQIATCSLARHLGAHSCSRSKGKKENLTN